MKYQIENFKGSYDFRSNIHHGWQVEAHLHEYSELLYCKRGKGDVYINGKQLPLCEGQLVWIPPNYIHQYVCPDAEVICAVFSNDMIPLFFEAVGEKRLSVAPTDMSHMAELLENFHLLKKENRLRISGYLNLILDAVLAAATWETPCKTDGILYQKVISYVSAHYAEDITLVSLARLFGYNKKYLSHALHTLTGVHFRQLLALYRVERAKELLRAEQERNISDIATACGFSAFNTFHRAFKEITGMTPTAYRQGYSQ